MNAKENETENLRSRFSRLAIVNILSNLMVPLAGLVDTAFLGHLTEIRHLAGVALATILFNYIYRPLNFLRMGTTGPTAQAEAISDSDTVFLIAIRNGLIALVLGSLILLFQYPLREVGFSLLSATPEVQLSGRAYYNTRIWDALPTLLNFVLIGWFLGREQSFRVLILSFIASGANVILDYFLIVRWGWDSAGAGIATAASQYLSLLAGLIFIAFDLSLNQWRAIRDRIFDLDAFRAIFKLNGNLWIRSLVFLSVYAFFTDLSASFGTVILATNSILLQIVILAAYFIDGLAFATESLAGSFIGAKMREKLIPLLKLASGISLVLGLTFAVVFVLFPQTLLGLLTNHLEVVERAVRYIIWLLPVLGFGSLAFILDGYFIGLAEGSTLRNSMLIAAVVGFAPLAIASWQLEETQILWAAMSLFMAARTVTLALQIPGTLGEKEVKSQQI
ncbi:MAG: guanitoxin biosynthesis MATE family efflux transporter GntT [Cyanobacteriota bacterium]|nr:guanitoxin biosynthesis MATE family efflux transporter GntT [Cyanobacteriota bacterium]